MPDYKLRIVVEGSDAGASRALGGVEKSLDNTAKSAKSASGGINSSLNSVVSNTQGASSSIQGSLNSIGGAFSNVGDKLRGMGTGLTAAVTLPIVGIATAAVSMASDLNESASKVEVVFGKMSSSVMKWSETASTALGVSQQQALESVGTFGNLFKSMGLGEEPTLKMSESLVQLASDLASFNNLDPKEVLDKLRAGITGEAEPLKTLGVNINAAMIQAKALTMGLGKSNVDMVKVTISTQKLALAQFKASEALRLHGRNSKEYASAFISVETAQQAVTNAMEGSAVELTAAEKAQAAYALIMEQTTTAQGDFARTSDGMANSMRIIKASITDIGASLGSILLPYVNQAAAKIKDFLLSFDGLSDGTKKWIVFGALAAAAIGPLLIGLGTLSSAIGVLLPALGAMSGAFLPIAIGLGGLAAAYRLNIGGLRTFVDGGLERVKKAAPLAGRALTELVARVKSIGTNTLVTGNGIRDFVGALTGSEETANNVTNGIIRLISRIDAAKVAFDSAGGGLQGFTAGLSQLVGQKITLDFKDNIVKLTWGDIFDLSAGFDPGDWSKGFVKLKIGDMVDFTQDWTNGITKLKISDFLDFAKDGEKTTLKISDYLTFDSTVDKTTLKIGDFYTLESTAEKIHVKISDFYEAESTRTEGLVKLTVGSFYKFEKVEEKVHVKIGDFYEAESTPTDGVTKLKFGDWYKFEATGDKITINIWDWYKLEETPTKKTIKLGDYVAFESTKTVLKFGDWFEWNMDEIHFDFHDLFPKKIDLTELLFGTTTTKGINLGVKMQGPTLDGFKPPLDFLAGVKWPELPAFKWPEFPKISVEWPTLPEIKWPALPTFSWPTLPSWSWPSLPSFSWPSLPTWTWPAYLTWSWPEIPTPSWLSSLLNWRPSISGLFGGSGGAVPSTGRSSGSIGGNASGTDNFAGGWTWVGEKGPELLNLPAGSKIMSNQKSMGMIGKLADGNYAPMPPIFMPQSKFMSASPVNIANDAKMLARMTDSYNALKSIENLSRIGPDKIVQAQDKNQLKLQQSIDGMFQKAPGVMQTSEVTQDQLDMAKLGIPQNFADDWVRHLTDEVVNGVQWKDADIKDAAMRAGIDPSLPAKAILGMVKDQWNSGQFFADAAGNAKNTDLLNMDAIKQSILQQQQQAAGKENLMQLSAIFGGTAGDLTQQGQVIGGQARAGIVQGLSGAAGAGAAGSAPAVDLSTILLGGSSTGITPEAVAPLAASFVSAFATALTGSKDDKDKGGIDFGAAIVAALTASLGNSDALAGVGQAILQKITESWKTIKDVDFIGGMAAAMALQIDTQGSIDALKNVGAKIAQLIKKGIDDYFKDAALADSISNSVSSTTSNATPTIPGQNASGTSFWKGGLSWVGERGAELVNLPRGAQVFNNGQSMAMAGAGGGGDIHIHATINTPIDVEKLAYRVSQIQQKRGR